MTAKDQQIKEACGKVDYYFNNVKAWLNIPDYDSAATKAEYLIKAAKELKKAIQKP